MTGRLLEELESLRRKVGTGDLRDLDAAASAIEAGLADMPLLDAAAIARVRDAAAANARCLDAALRGLRAARRRVEELVAAERPETYDVEGRRKGMSVPATGAAKEWRL